MTVTTFSRPNELSQRVDPPTKPQRQIDQEIRLLENRVRDLKSQRNSLCTISRLPPEMLSKVFSFCAIPLVSENPLSWISVGQVCRHWRAVALATPSLWSSLVFSSPSWAHEQLKRSKMALLNIKADMTYMSPKMVEAVISALKHISRTSELQLTADRRSMEKVLELLEKPAPFLQYLRISSARGTYSYTNIDAHYSLTEKFLNGEAPRLRHLELIRTSLPWNSPILCNLVTLKIHGDEHIGLKPTMSQLLSVLEAMPNLEVLDLASCLPSLPEDSTSPLNYSKTVQLPKLSRIQISSVSTLECASLLNHLALPPLITMVISCTGDENTDNNFTTLHPIVTQYFNPDGKRVANVKGMTIRHNSFASITLQIWTTTPPDDKPFNSQSIALEMTLSWRHGDIGVMAKSEEVIRGLCRVLPLAYLRTLRIRHIMQYSADMWVSCFGSLPRLRSIALEGAYVMELIDALGYTSTVTPGSPQRKAILRNDDRVLQIPSMRFPRLRSLSLREADFDYGGMLDKLLDCLMLRVEHKAPLQELDLEECRHLVLADVNLLEEITTDVHWDGLEMGLTDSEDEDMDMNDYFLSDGQNMLWGAPDYYNESDESDFW